MKLKWKFDIQVVIAFGVMIVSFSALFVSMYQARIMNKQTEVLLTQTKANSWPCLTIGKTELGDKKNGRIGTYYFTVQNKGTGPAIVQGVRLTFKGKVAKDWMHLHDVMQTPDSIKRYRILSPISQSIVSADELVRIIDYTNNLNMIDWMIKNGNDLLLEIYYKSVFGDIWLVKRRLNNDLSSYPVKVDKCPIKEDEQFQN